MFACCSHRLSVEIMRSKYMKQPRSLITRTTDPPTLALLRRQCCAAHRFIVPVLCKILFRFAQRFHGARNNNSTGHYGGGLMGRVLKLMGNASPSHREAFLTLMERGMSRGEVGGRTRFTGSQTPAELQWSSLPPWNSSYPSCLPSFFPSPALLHHTQAFAFLLCGNVVLTYLL